MSNPPSCAVQLPCPNRAIITVPKIPPTPCTAKTSSVSSILKILRTKLTASWHNMPATAPMIKASTGPTKPEAGVIEASPAMVPVTNPTSDARPYFIFSQRAQVKEAVAAEIWVTVKAIAAPPSAASCEPPLKPNQPTHSIAAPIITIPGLWGGLLLSRRGPNIAAINKAARPAVSCTTIPPAKSRTPVSPKMPPSAIIPPPQIQCTTGA